MNLHMNANATFPIISVIAALLGLFIFVAAKTKEPYRELGRALMWCGILTALFAAHS